MLAMAEQRVDYGPSRVVPPWNKSYSDWNRMQLDVGLVACAEFGWDNLTRQIQEEIAYRDRRYKRRVK